MTLALSSNPRVQKPVISELTTILQDDETKVCDITKFRHHLSFFQNLPFEWSQTVTKSTLSYFIAEVNEFVTNLWSYDLRIVTKIQICCSCLFILKIFNNFVTSLSNLIPERNSNKKIGDVLWNVFYYGALFRFVLTILIYISPFGIMRRNLLRLSYRIFGM